MSKLIVYGDDGPYNLRLSDVRVVTLIVSTPGLLRSQIAERLNIQPGEAGKSLSKLYREGLINRDGMRPYKYYMTPEKKCQFDELLIMCWEKPESQ